MWKVKNVTPIVVHVLIRRTCDSVILHDRRTLKIQVKDLEMGKIILGYSVGRYKRKREAGESVSK